MSLADEYKLDPNKEGQDLIKKFFDTRRAFERAETEYRMAQHDFNQAHDELAKWLMPADACIGEKFGVWHGTVLLQVFVESRNPDKGTVSIRRGHIAK